MAVLKKRRGAQAMKGLVLLSPLLARAQIDVVVSEASAQTMTWLGLVVCGILAVAYTVYDTKKAQAKQGQAADAGEQNPIISLTYWSGRFSQPWHAVAISTLATSLGSWILYAPEMGARRGWWGVFAYAVSALLPLAAMMKMGPRILETSGGSEGFCMVDWAGWRFGRTGQVIVTLASAFYCVVAMTAELTGASYLLASLTGWTLAGYPLVNPFDFAWPIAIVTVLYTVVGGLRASIVTDKLQGVIIVFFSIAALAILFETTNTYTAETLAEVGYHESDPVTWEANTSERSTQLGALAFFSLCVNGLGGELMNQSLWQRIWAAETKQDMIKGVGLGASLVFVLMFFFTMLGTFAAAQDLALPVEERMVLGGFEWNSFFHLMSQQNLDFKRTAFLLTLCLGASSLDSLQNAVAAIFAKDFNENVFKNVADEERRAKYASGAARLTSIVLTVIALSVTYSSTRETADAGDLTTSILNLWFPAGVIGTCAMVPLFSGVYTTRTCEKSLLAGFVSAVLTIMSFGWGEFGTFVAGFEMLTFMSFGETVPTLDKWWNAGLWAERSLLSMIAAILVGSFVSACGAYFNKRRGWEFTPPQQAKLADGNQPTKKDQKGNANISPTITPPDEVTAVGV